MATLKVTNIKNESFAGDQLYLKTDGKIGIGTTSPLVPLQVKGSGSNGQIFLGGSGAYAQLYADNDGVLILSADHTNSAANSYFAISIDTSEKFRIKSDGNVGIGTTSPTNKLEISGGLVRCLGTASARFTVNNGAAEGFFGWNSGTLYLGGASALLNIAASGSNNIQLETNSSTRMTIKSDGNIEVGGNLKTNNLPGRNLIINGAMQVAQRSASVSSISSGGYHLCDRWDLGYGSAGTWTLSQSTESPNNFGKSFKFDCTTANGSLSANSNLQLKHYFEGQNVQHLEKGTATAKQVTVSFYLKTNKTGTYIVELMDHDNSNRHCNKSYTVSNTNWNRYTLTFPGDTTGTLNDDNAKSFEVAFWLVAGSTFTGGSLQTSWGSLNQGSRAVGQVNLADSTSNEWHLTGVQLEIGSIATEFEHRSYGDELQRCSRYCQVMTSNATSERINFADVTVHGTGAGIYIFPGLLPMRTAPSITTSGSFSASVITGGWTATAVSSITSEFTTNNGNDRATWGFDGMLSATIADSCTIGLSGQIFSSSGFGQFVFSAEL